MTVLVVDDESAISGMVRDQLEARGVTVHVAATLSAARESLLHQDFAVVILDLGLPDGSGLTLLGELRQSGSTAHVIILSGEASEAGRIAAFDLGANDYLVKPFSVRELTARVLGARRRRTADSRLHIGNLEIDLVSRSVAADGRELELTAKEFDLLAFLAARPGHAFTRDELLRSVWQSAADWQQPATVTEHVRRLRAKLEVDRHDPKLLRTVRGVGYRLDAPARSEEITNAHVPPVIATIVAVDGIVVSADATATALLGSPEVDLAGTPVLELVAPRSLGAAHQRSETAGAGKTLRSQLMYFVDADGREFQAEINSAPEEWDHRPARRLHLTVAADASERLRRCATGVVTELSDAVIVTDPHFHIQCWNHAAERLYGWSEHEVKGRHLLDIVPDAELDGSLADALGDLHASGRWFGNARQTTRDGSYVTVRATTAVVRDDDGQAIGVVSVNRPVDAADDRSPAVQATHDEAAIRRALDHDEFDVWYQPCVALDDRHIVAVEALVRWNHPERGVLTPAHFIGTAERSGMIVELGTFVQNRACRQVAAWRRAGIDVDLAVNLSATELVDPTLAARIAASLAAAGLSASRLWLEVTESSLVEDFEQASEALHAIARTGVRISIDDFGTGWASLTYLKRFPIHALKIDRTFVDGLEGSANDVAIVRSVLSLGAELGLLVTAEGVETEAQERTLKKLGCESGQGFLYGKPTPAAEVPVWRARRIDGTAPVGSTPIVEPERAARATVAVRAPGEFDDEDGPVTDMLRALLRIRSVAGAAEILQTTARRLGATLVATDATGDALPIDLSLGEGPAVLATATPMSAARVQLERVLPRLVEDARWSIDLLHQAEPPPSPSDVGPHHDEEGGEAGDGGDVER